MKGPSEWSQENERRYPKLLELRKESIASDPPPHYQRGLLPQQVVSLPSLKKHEAHFFKARTASWFSSHTNRKKSTTQVH